ncbi:hypothetical protein ACK8P5_25740 (plasmid) [Paenibacillus sp. EC2-1]|uniref:hypothetical protein n=1 Tax=Paenibacillus sp. EC2-1 TaxID=3388665 RepID=UPI003BEF079E
MSLKRAKWIEGITTSRRILRDLSEIITTAIKDDEGLVKADENWELIYPRPFEEGDVVRGKLVKDTTDLKNLRYIPTGSRSETIKLTSTGDSSEVTLSGTNIVEGSLVVKSLNGVVTYEADTDYKFVTATRKLTLVEGGGILSGAELIVTYDYRFSKILDTVPVVVEKVLDAPTVDRVVANYDYSIDYAGGFVDFVVQPPKAEHFSLTFTEITGVVGREDRTKIQLELDPMISSGRRFRLPIGTKSIAAKKDYQTVAAAVSGLKGTGQLPYTLDKVAKKVTFDSDVSLPSGRGALLVFNCYEFNNASMSTGTHQLTRALLELDPTPVGNKKVYSILGTNSSLQLNELEPHSVELYTENTEPVLELHLSDQDAKYTQVEAMDYIVSYDNPAINFITEPSDEFVATFKSRGAIDLELGLSKITDRVVLKTITRPESSPTGSVDNDYGAIDQANSLEMYVEIQKPKRLINPETGLERYNDIRGAQIGTQDNNHFIQVRMFDLWDDAIQQPTRISYNADGSVKAEGASISNWSKYAWFKDWKEYLVDELDDDAGISNMNDGIIFQEIKTNGIDDNFPIQFWLSTNNNRIAMILMGDPTLDQDNFLTSFAYLGRIQPFYDTHYRVKVGEDGEVVKDTGGQPIVEEIHEYFGNDVSGNFAITTGSSTLPADIGIPPKGEAYITNVSVAYSTGVTPVPGEMFDNTVYSYLVTYLADGGESKPSSLNSGKIVVGKVVATAGLPTKGISLKLQFNLPDEATGYKIYRFHETAKTTFDAIQSIKYENYKLVKSVSKMDADRNITFIDDGNDLPMEQMDTVAGTLVLINNSWNPMYRFITGAVPTPRSFESVVRDKYTGSILAVKFSEKFGIGTGTGVNDMVMYKTRSGLKYQRHIPAFITTEEFMKKEKSGQSRYTGKFHLSPIYVEHSYDKQRGWLDGVMAVDDSGIAHLDELIVDKDTPREEVYKFFRINAPYSFLNNSSNYSFGLAIIKSSLRWTNK